MKWSSLIAKIIRWYWLLEPAVIPVGSFVPPTSGRCGRSTSTCRRTSPRRSCDPRLKKNNSFDSKDHSKQANVLPTHRNFDNEFDSTITFKSRVIFFPYKYNYITAHILYSINFIVKNYDGYEMFLDQCQLYLKQNQTPYYVFLIWQRIVNTYSE